jgi:hypothetical protein
MHTGTITAAAHPNTTSPYHHEHVHTEPTPVSASNTADKLQQSPWDCGLRSSATSSSSPCDLAFDHLLPKYQRLSLHPFVLCKNIRTQQSQQWQQRHRQVSTCPAQVGLCILPGMGICDPACESTNMQHLKSTLDNVIKANIDVKHITTRDGLIKQYTRPDTYHRGS